MENIEKKYNFINNQLEQIRRKVSCTFISQYHRYWKIARQTQSKFDEKNELFMKNNFTIEFKKVNLLSFENIASNNLQSDSNLRGRGRPRKNFENCSRQTQKRRFKELQNKYNQAELINAIIFPKTKQKLNKSKNKFSKDLINGTLALYMDMGMTREKYEHLRKYNARYFGNKQCPPYAQIQAAKIDCFPRDITITEKRAEIKLQALLDHTVSRIISLITEIKDFQEIDYNDFVLYGKWGMDGASGQQNFKQQWSINDENNNNNNDTAYLNDSTVFVISYVPLVLSFNNDILWKNDRPSSVCYCRPIKFEFFKETSSNILREYNFYTTEIDNLKPTIVIQDQKTIKVTHNLQCTMIDGKVCNVLTNQKSSMSCNICGATPKEMNDLEKIKQLKCNEDNYKFGLSTLHCWIRFMECILHISYNIDFKQSSARKNNKILKQNKKKQVQHGLKLQLGITVDVVKQSHGTTNDGNTARRFFADSKVVSDIIKVDQKLIKRFGNTCYGK